MKLKLFKFAVAALFCAIPLMAMSQTGILLNEGFEDSSGLPDGWDLEYSVGQHPWEIESGGLTYPDGAYSGNGRIAFRNTTGTTQGYVTRLVTPEIDASGFDELVLTFAYAAPQWTNDFDILRIMYRSNPDGAWTTISEYSDTYTPVWRRVEVALRGFTGATSYQLAFEAVDRLGRGVVLDDIVISSPPSCDPPTIYGASEITPNSAKIQFMLNWPSESAIVLVSSTELTDAQLDAEEAEIKIPSVTSGIASLTGLTFNTRYFFYVKGICPDGESPWATGNFRTASLADVPFNEDFNEGARIPEWTYYNSKGEVVPYINASTPSGDRQKYSKDATTAFMFTDVANIDQPIPAGNLVYAVTPQLVVDNNNISGVQVSFYGTFYEESLLKYSRRLIVGVMTDADMFSTFTPVDTVELTEPGVFKRFDISLGSYTGNGKHIAFVSNFNEPNAFYLDDLTIDVTPNCRVPYNVDLSIISSAEIRVSWNASGAAKGDVILSKTAIDVDDVDINAAGLIKKLDETLGSPISFSGLEAGTYYYISVRNACENGKWSNPIKFRTPATAISALPFTVNFEEATTYEPKAGATLPIALTTVDNMGATVSRIINATTGNELPQRSAKELELVAIPGGYSYVIFPAFSSNCEVSFWYGSYLKSNVGTKFKAGLLSDPADLSSFESIATLETRDTWLSARFDLTGKTSKFFALMIENPASATGSISAYIDDVVFATVSTCKEPVNIEVIPAETTAAAAWDANSATKWNVRVTTEEVLTSQLATLDEFVFQQDGLTSPSVTINNLLPNLTVYFLYVGTVCADNSIVWSGATKFMTECPTQLPYVLDFESYETGGKAVFVVPCLYTEVKPYSTTNYFPQVFTRNPHNGSAKALNFNYKGGLPATVANNDLYVALPKMTEVLSNLQLTMYVNPHNGSQGEFAVGVMSDPYDINTFDTLQTFTYTAAGYNEIFMRFNGMERNDLHIAMRTKGCFIVDDITIEPKDPCFQVKDIEVSGIKNSSVDVQWLGDTETQWDIIVSETVINSADLSTVFATPTADVAYSGTVASNPYTVNGLTPETTYYVYVRANCGAVVGEWAIQSATFKTGCASINPGASSLESFDDYGTGSGRSPNCWTMGLFNKVGVAGTDATHTPYCSDVYKHGDNGASLYFNSGIFYSARNVTVNDAYAISPRIANADGTVVDITKYQVSFYGTCGSYYSLNNECKLIVAVMTSPDDWSDASYLAIDTVVGYAQEQYYTVTLDKARLPSGEKPEYIVFRSNFSRENYFYIDDVIIEEIPDCKTPTNVTIDETANNSVTASWTGGAPEYTAVVADRPLTKDELDNIESYAGNKYIGKTSTNSVTVSGMTVAGGKYYLYVRSGCTNGAWSAAVPFNNSECPKLVDLPYFEDFDANMEIGKYVTPDCWTSFYNNLTDRLTYPYLDGEGRLGKSVWIETANENDRVLLISPEFNRDDLSGSQVSFYVSAAGLGGSQRSIVVGTVSNVSGIDAAWASFRPMDTIYHSSSEWLKCVVPVTDAAANGKRIAFTTIFSSNNSGSDGVRGIKIDEIEIEEIPTCAKPDDLMLINRTDNSLTVGFTAVGIATAWEVQYGAQGFNIGTGTPANTPVESHHITGLTAETAYDVYVRAVCGDDDKSRWVGPLTVQTTTAPLANFESVDIDFEDEAENAKWMFSNGGQNAWSIGTARQNGGAKALYVSKDNGETAEYDVDAASISWAYRPIVLKAGSYTFNYEWIGVGEGNNDFMKIGLIPITADIVGGVDYILLNRDKIFLPAASDDHNGPYYSLQPDGQSKLNGKSAWQPASYTYVVDEAMAGNYAMVLMWRNNASGGENPSAAIDNISIEYASCLYPTNVKVEEATSNGGTISWVSPGAAGSYDVVVMDAEISPDDENAADHTILTTTSTTTSITIDDAVKVFSNVTYYVYVRAVCGDDNKSIWSEAASLTTTCGVISITTTFDFNNDADSYTLANGARIPNCFVAGHKNPSIMGNKSAFMQMVGDTTVLATMKNRLSRSGKALAFYITSKANAGGYIALPPFAEDLNDMQISFYMRGGYIAMNNGVPTTGKLGDVARGTNIMTITVGTMTNPYDASTFVKISDVPYPYDNTNMPTTGEVVDNDFWVKMSVPLAGAAGKYIAFMHGDYSSNYTRNTVAIDDIVIEPAEGCIAPYNLSVDSIGDVAARLSFVHAEDGTDWEVHVSSVELMSDTLYLDTVHTGRAVLRNLNPNATHYVRARQLCGEENSDWSPAARFTTVRTIKHLDEFTNNSSGWSTRMGRSPLDINRIFTSGINSVSDDYTNGGWTHNNGLGLPGGHMVCRPKLYSNIGGMKGNMYSHFFMSPVIHLSDNDNAHLTFDLALTKVNTGAPIDALEKGEDDAMFVVAISEDGGNSWKPENATFWDNSGTADYVFDDIKNGENIRIDLSNIKGKNIQVAFFYQYDRPEGDLYRYADLHIDNFRINNYYEVVKTDNVCEAVDYFSDDFGLILNEDIKVGVENRYYDADYVAGNTPDTLYTLVLTATPMAEYDFSATICNGDTYTDYGFNASTAGVHKVKGTASNGCDSVAVLNLTVITIPETVEYDSICLGSSIVWNGKTLTDAGVYRDTIPSSFGCDSVVTLNLSVEYLIEEKVVTLCHGESIEIGDLGSISTSGEYTDTIPSSSGCDSIIRIDLTVLPDLNRVVDTAICVGEVYVGDGFTGGLDETGIHSASYQENGCDASIVLTLVVIDPANPVTFEHRISRDKLPFEFFGEVFDENTPAGTHRKTITVNAANCTGEVELILHVEEVSPGVDNTIKADHLTITPNPVNAGEDVFVHLELTPAQRNGLTVQVYTSAGTLVQSFMPKAEEIVVRDLYTSGVYIVRVVDGTGKAYQGKVIVR